MPFYLNDKLKYTAYLNFNLHINYLQIWRIYLKPAKRAASGNFE
jgi:hypothetical protein